MVQIDDHCCTQRCPEMSPLPQALSQGTPAQETSPFSLSCFLHLRRQHCEYSTGESRPPEPLPAEGPARDSGAIRFLGSVLTRLLAPERLRPLLPSGLNDYVPATPKRLLRLRPGGCSWDCTAYIILHRRCSTTSSKTSRVACRLLQQVTAQPVPPALVPPWGTF